MRPWSWFALTVALAVGILVWLAHSSHPNRFSKPIQVPANNPEFRKSVEEWKRDPSGSNAPARLGTNRPTVSGISGLTETEREDLKTEFEDKLRPALLRWAAAYAGHIPFDADSVSLTQFYGRMKAGIYANYTFMVNGATLVLEDMNGTAHVQYLNAPATAQLMALPKGEPPDVSVPVTKEEVARMIKEESGRDFSPQEIQLVPTALSSAMQGGVHVMVGGNTRDAGSWLYTLTYGSDKMLTYYMKAPDVQFQAHDKSALSEKK